MFAAILRASSRVSRPLRFSARAPLRSRHRRVPARYRRGRCSSFGCALRCPREAGSGEVQSSPDLGRPARLLQGREVEQGWAAAALLTISSLHFGVETIITSNWKGPIMKRFIVATLVGLTIAVSLSTSASAFRCLARSSNGVNTWGYGIFFSRAAHFAVRHCRVAGGIDCHVAYCR